MRVRLSKKNLKVLFSEILKIKKSWKNVAIDEKISIRTLDDWRRDISTMPFNTFKKFVNIIGSQQIFFKPKLLSDNWHLKEISRKGALKRLKLYGNFGTPDGRRRGGINSLITHQKQKDGFMILKPINEPPLSEKLAELMGILVGDGHLSKYQVSITTNAKTDREHALFTCSLIKELFNISVSLKNRKNENTLNIIVSSKNLVKFLHCKGMPTGNKIQNHLSVPCWIFKQKSYQKAFIRGLFDTDGCIYLDVHKINKKLYKHCGLVITSYADKLIIDIIKIFKNLGFSPTHRLSQKSVYLRKQKEIIRYFLEIGTDNPKHYRRYKKFIGGVPKWS